MTDIKQVREQAVQYGLNSLNDTELLKLLGFSGSVSFEELIRRGDLKAQAIVNMVRRYERQDRDKNKITSSSHARGQFEHLELLYHEEFWLLTMNRMNMPIAKYRISTGSQTGTVVDVRDVVRKSLDDRATGIILCHNHPSGTVRPSDQDKIITRQVKEAAQLFNIELFDHVIIGNANEGQTGTYFSFADEGLI